MPGGSQDFVVDYTQLAKLGGDFERLAKVMRDDSPRALRAAKRAAATVTGHIRREVMASVETSETSVRTGGLARSFRDFVNVSINGMTFGSASDLIYAGVQDQGATIYPRSRKALAVPLIRMAVGKWPRTFPKGELFRVGNTLARRVGKGKRSRLEFVFALVGSVRIKPKFYIEKAARAAIPDVAKILLNAMTEAA